ncbi:MAG: CHAP domain-containing protein [Ruminococcus sp.]|nr:CHAP domain-containing protein [Ruminococcus sp.]
MKTKRMVCILTVISVLASSLFVSFGASAQDNYKYSDEYKTSPYYEKLVNALDSTKDKSAMERTLAVALSQEGYKNYATEGVDLDQARADGLLWTGKELRNNSSKTGNTEYTRWAQRYIMDRNESTQYLDCDWCAIFVSWCLYQAGYSDDERLKRYYYSYFAEPRIEFDADSWIMAYNFKQQGVYYTPKAHHKLDKYYWNTYYHIDVDPFDIPYQPGGLIFFSWDSSGQWFDHVAIVVDYDKDTHVLTYTNGNSDGQVITRQIDLDVEEEFRGQQFAKNSDRVMAYVDYDLILPPEQKIITTDTPNIVWDKSADSGVKIQTNSESIIVDVSAFGRKIGDNIKSNMILREGMVQVGKSELVNLPNGSYPITLSFDDGTLDLMVTITDFNNNPIGDVNRDGVINVNDVTDIQKHLAGIKRFNEDQLKWADTNGDDMVDINDATQLQKYIAGYSLVLGKGIA